MVQRKEVRLGRYLFVSLLGHPPSLRQEVVIESEEEQKRREGEVRRKMKERQSLLQAPLELLLLFQTLTIASLDELR
jgi:hypothetical protein